MGRIARLLKTEIDKYILQTVEAHYGQNQLCDSYGPAGDDAPPLPDDRVLLEKVEGSGIFVSCGCLAISQGAEPGEKLIYSRDPDSKELKAKIYLKKDGSIEIEGASLTIKPNGNFEVDAGSNEIKLSCSKFTVNDGNLEVT